MTLPKNYRPYTTYKAFGGVVAVLFCSGFIGELLRIIRNQEPISIPWLITLFVFCVLALSIFIMSDRKIDELKKEDIAKQENADGQIQGDQTLHQRISAAIDIKAMLLLAAALILYLILIML